MGAADVINAAKTAWDVIDGGAVSPDVSTSTASAMPHVDDTMALSAPIGTNRMGRQIRYFNDRNPPDEVVDVYWSLNWEYGTTYKGGGAYIPNVWMTVDRSSAGWHWDVSLKIYVHNPTNAGTEKAPIARLPISLVKHVRSYAGITDETETFEWVIYGDGRIETNGH